MPFFLGFLCIGTWERATEHMDDISPRIALKGGFFDVGSSLCVGACFENLSRTHSCFTPHCLLVFRASSWNSPVTVSVKLLASFLFLDCLRASVTSLTLGLVFSYE